MRTAFLAVSILLLIAQPAAPQTAGEPLTVSAVLQQMSNSRMDEREKAFDEALKLLASKSTIQGDIKQLRLGVIQLLIAENARNDISDTEAARLADQENAKNEAACEHSDNCRDDEEDVEDPSTAYMHRLIATVAGFNDERAIPALAGAVGWDDNVTSALLAFGYKALAPVIDQLKGRNSFRRISALDMAIALLETSNDAASQYRIKKLIRSSLDDTWPLVRTHAVDTIDCRKDRLDFVPLLQEVAKTDPFILPGRALDGGDGGKFYPVRAHARRALRHIQRNELCTVPD